MFINCYVTKILISCCTHKLDVFRHIWYNFFLCFNFVFIYILAFKFLIWAKLMSYVNETYASYTMSEKPVVVYDFLFYNYRVSSTDGVNFVSKSITNVVSSIRLTAWILIDMIIFCRFIVFKWSCIAFIHFPLLNFIWCLIFVRLFKSETAN